jgi:superfamily I DNA/RNA helicase/CRISPR/Cas system-associated exonuclease Cas4 (RecB family)
VRQLLTGPPGSGKTRALVARFAELVSGGADPERVLLLVLNRRAAREAREHLLRGLGRSLPTLNVHTAHSYAYGVLNRRFGELGYTEAPQVLSAAEQYATVRELLVNDEPGHWPVFGHLMRVRGFARELADFVLRAQERLYDPASLADQAARSGRGSYAEVVAFFGRYLDVMSASNRVDFAGVLHQAVVALQSELADDDRMTHLLVDDYQDVTPAAEAIVVALAGGADSTVIAADPHGHVFAYRGGSLEPLGRIDRVLSPDRVVLGGVPRLDPVALEALDDPSAPAAAAPPSGLDARCCAHPGEEADAIAHELLRARVDEGMPWERMAVIVRRYGEYLTAIRHALQRHDVPFVVLGEASAIAGEPASRTLIQLLRYAIFPDRRDELLEPVLSSPVVGLDPHALRRLRREARRREVSVYGLVHTVDLDDAMPIDLRESVEGFRSLVAGLEERCPTEPPDGVFFWLWSNLRYARELVENEGERRRDLDALSALGDIIGRFSERREGARMIDYLETLEAAEFGPDPWVLPGERRPHAVQVLSAHRAHGHEYDLVCVAGCVEGEFPAPHRAPALVDVDDLLAPRTAGERLRDSLAEERRLFRLAVTRARGRTLLFASASPSGMHPRTPTRYAGRLGLPDWDREAVMAGPSASLRSIEAELRRTIADTAAPRAERVAALAAIPAAHAEPSGWWGRRDWTDPGEVLYPSEIRTSYSRLSNMEDCALKYLYEVEMGLDPSQSYQMWLGSLVHSIIDRVQRNEIPRDIDEIERVLTAEWRSDIFPGRAIEHRRRLDASEMFRRWIVGEQAEVAHSEVGFEYPLGDAVIRGKIDAIFRMSTPGKLRLVDYKTGRYPPTKEETEVSLQLGAYYLAMVRDPELAKMGRPGWLQLSYLGDFFGESFSVRAFAPREGYEQWAEDTIRGLVANIREESFAPNPEADCRFCSFKPICPVWPEGGEVVR